MNIEPSSTVTLQDLGAYFDEELTAEQAEAVALALTEDPQLRSQHTELGLLGGVLRSALETEAEAVPDARFAQIWDEIDRAIQRDARLQADANRNASVWTRLWAALRPVRVPVLAAAAAAAVAVVFLGQGTEAPNNPESTPSVAETSQPTPAPVVAPTAQPDRLALEGPTKPVPSTTDAKLAPMPVPQSNEAEIHGIEFGGKQGRISNTGTVTVLYVEEDETPPNSERSL